MKAALIPPVPDLKRYATGPGIHLLLSHLFSKKGYLEYYRERSDEGDYLILDNSAHENGIGNKIEVLLKEAEKVAADEIVVPDVLFDSWATVEAARRSLKFLESGKGIRVYERSGSPRLMYVPQGNNRPEWARCLVQLLTLHRNSFGGDEVLDPPVIGISKDYYWWPGGISILLEKYLEKLRHEWEGLDVHLLGWPSDLWQTAEVARRFPWVRSTDSAKPFVYAKNKILLEPGGEVPTYPRRDSRYFDDPLPEEVAEIVWRNVEVFNAAANDALIISR